MVLFLAAILSFVTSVGAVRLVSNGGVTLAGNMLSAESRIYHVYMARAEGNASSNSAGAVLMSLQMYNGSDWQELEYKVINVGDYESTATWGRSELDQRYAMRIQLTPNTLPIFGGFPGRIGSAVMYVDPDSAE